MSLYSKKVLPLFGCVIIIIFFQNCDTGFNGQEFSETSSLKVSDTVSLETISKHKIQSFLVERQYAGFSYLETEKRITKISATLDLPVSPMDQQVDIRNSDYKMLISKEEESFNGEKCYSIYSVNQDDIRKLLDSLTEIVVLNANNEYKDVNFPAVMPNKDVYSVRINDYKEKIFLGFTPWFGPLFTNDLSLKDFTHALSEHKDKIISSNCYYESKIKSFSMNLTSFGSFGQSVDTLVLTHVSAVPDIPISPNDKTNSIQSDKMLVLKKTATNFGKGKICTDVYSILRSDIAEIFKRLETMTIHEKILDTFAGGPTYSVRINDSKEQIHLGPFGIPFTNDIGSGDFVKVLEKHKDKIISSHCQPAVQ